MGQLTCFRTGLGTPGLRSDADLSEQPWKRLKDSPEPLGIKTCVIWSEGWSGLCLTRSSSRIGFTTAPDSAPTDCICRVLGVTDRSDGAGGMLLRRKTKDLLSGVYRQPIKK